jgi:S1-C subfamily serine protease
MIKKLLILLSPILLLIIVTCCAFIPKQVDINSIENRFIYPREVFGSKKTIKFEEFIDKRANKEKLGVGRNKLMMVTSYIGFKGNLQSVLERIVKQNFAAHGIGDGESPYILKGAIIEAQTDAWGPDHIYVQIQASLTMLDNRDNTPIFYKTLKGYHTTPVTQVSNSAWEDAFIGAINQISDEINIIAMETAKFLKSGNKFTETPSNVSTGTGVIVHPNGLILTAYHIIENATKLSVELSNKRKFDATILQSDPANDLALLKISDTTLNYLPLAPVRSTKIGQYVFTIGFPAITVLGSEPKFTDGSISALTGPQGIACLLQISVPVQPGNSGGPLVNEFGEIVGIITSTASVANFIRETGTLPQNVNWAVKADYARPLFDPPARTSHSNNRDEAIKNTQSAIVFIEALKNLDEMKKTD